MSRQGTEFLKSRGQIELQEYRETNEFMSSSDSLNTMNNQKLGNQSIEQADQELRATDYAKAAALVIGTVPVSRSALPSSPPAMRMIAFAKAYSGEEAVIFHDKDNGPWHAMFHACATSLQWLARKMVPCFPAGVDYVMVNVILLCVPLPILFRASLVLNLSYLIGIFYMPLTTSPDCSWLA